jgi:NAD(P)-dependent dehydrogenase (short-subunit alcohol dehydrogenase family)
MSSCIAAAEQAVPQRSCRCRYIATDMLSTIPDKMMDTFRAKIPVGRIGRPGEIARVVAFLADDDSSYITGQIWAVNGGLDM